MLKSLKVLSAAVLVTATYPINSLVYLKSRSFVNLRSSGTQNQRGSLPTAWPLHLPLFGIDKFAIGIKETSRDTAHDGH
jgi:hypothetical protein